MPAGSAIKPHRDSGGYPLLSHRIHIPLFIPKCVLFEQRRAGFRHDKEVGDGERPEKQWVELSDEEKVAKAETSDTQVLVEKFGHSKGRNLRTLVQQEWVEIPFKEGETFEVNNIIQHQVKQTGPFDRVTVIIDIMEKPCSKHLDVMPGCTDWTADGCFKEVKFSKGAWRGEVEFEEV
jgi:hypothetical protein